MVKIIYQPVLSCIYVMFLSFYTFIILIVQVTDSVNVNDNHRFLEPLRNKDTLPRIRAVVKREADNKRTDKLTDETKFFYFIQEENDYSTSKALVVREDNTLGEIKNLLQKLLAKLNSMEHPATSRSGIRQSKSPTSESPQKKRNQSSSSAKRQRWGTWTPWSTCSVSCGKGRVIRWRHCIEECETAETEMEEKTCQLPACGPGKLFGFKL